MSPHFFFSQSLFSILVIMSVGIGRLSTLTKLTDLWGLASLAFISAFYFHMRLLSAFQRIALLEGTLRAMHSNTAVLVTAMDNTPASAGGPV